MMSQCHQKWLISFMKTWNGLLQYQSFQRSKQHTHRSQGNRFIMPGQRWVKCCGSEITCSYLLQRCCWSNLMLMSTLMLPKESSNYAWGWRKYWPGWREKLLRSEWMSLVRPSLLGQSVLANITWTDNTNSSNLELYSIMGEYDNASFPLTYCLINGWGSQYREAEKGP